MMTCYCSIIVTRVVSKVLSSRKLAVLGGHLLVKWGKLTVKRENIESWLRYTSVNWIWNFWNMKWVWNFLIGDFKEYSNLSTFPTLNTATICLTIQLHEFEIYIKVLLKSRSLNWESQFPPTGDILNFQT